MTIIKQDGVAFGLLNVVLVGAILFFTVYALNRWVAPVWVAPTV